MSLSKPLGDLSPSLGEAPPEQEAGTLPAWSIVPNRPIQNPLPPYIKSSAARHKNLRRPMQNPPPPATKTFAARCKILCRTMQNPSPLDAKSSAARCKILCRSKQNFFSGTEIYFQSFKIYFQASEIYFQALEIVLFPAAKEKYLRDEEIASLYAGNYCCTGKSTRQQYKGIARLRLKGFRLETERFFP